MRNLSGFFLSTFLILSVLLGACTNTIEPDLPTPTAAPPTAAVEVSAPEPTVDYTSLTCADEEVLCVGVVINRGLFLDKSFNQSTWEGVKRATVDLAARVEYVEGENFPNPFEGIDYFAEKEFDVIVTVGFNWSEPTLEAAEKYPDISFVGVDQFQAAEKENVAGLVFPELKAGFLAGALAAMVSQNNKVAAVLGTDLVPPVVAFGQGFEMGARAIKPDIEVDIAHHPGDILVSFNDPEWGAETARTFLDAGADVIFGAGGETGNGALIEVATESSALCIGVDADQWLTIPEAQPCLITSAMKEISDGVFKLVALSVLDNFPAGNFSGDVGLAPFHQFEQAMPAEARALLRNLNKGLVDGSIPTDGSYTIQNPPVITINR